MHFESKESGAYFCAMQNIAVVGKSRKKSARASLSPLADHITLLWLFIEWHHGERMTDPHALALHALGY